MRSKSHLLVNLSHLGDNLMRLRELAPSPQVLFMVKANAYGHGIYRIVDYCFHHLELTSFGVASLSEAVKLRRLSGHYEYELYVFSDLSLADHWEYYLNYKLLPVISHIDDLKFYLSHPQFRYLPLVLFFDTGMNRLGLSESEGEWIMEQLKDRGRSVYHLMTHFSDSFLPQREKTRNQYQRFLRLKEEFSLGGVDVVHTSVANSAAIENGIGLDESMIRPGLMLYGLQSTEGPLVWRGKPLSSLLVEVLQVRTISKGESVGYGSMFPPAHWEEGRTLCIMALGYGDGLGNGYRGLRIEREGYRGEIFGKVNMDMLQVVFPRGTPIRRGELLPFWTHSQERLAYIAQKTGLVPHEITTLLQERLPRVYIM